MSERKVFYRDHLDQDRPACRVQSIEAGTAQARNLHRRQRRAVVGRIEGAGVVLRNEELIRRSRKRVGSGLMKLGMLLVTLTIACGAAAAITVSFSPIDQVQDEDRGY